MLFLVWCFTDKEECWQMIGPLGDVLGVYGRDLYQ